MEAKCDWCKDTGRDPVHPTMYCPACEHGPTLRLAAEHAEMKELLEQLLGIPVDVLNRPGNLDFILDQARSLLARLNKKEE